MLYFAYGANLNRAHMHLWCPSSAPAGRAALADYRLAFRFWADVVPSPGDAVPGALYKIAASDLEALDEYEDYPSLYERVRVTVQTESGPLEAFTYRLRAGRTFALPDDDYLSLIEQGYEDWGLDPALLMLQTEPDGPAADSPAPARRAHAS
jgi:gamma-glutamylcyclotransferase (GGCT)/AIG2-like uncharacterized protein YtfP